ncbi:MAG: hypothetical protein B6D46_01375 [Polyangiaceae bacterium UTPRO1]|nr:MAG: hypothetical protein B6D46_01375 [Polyangiaceae bacterium UTPRO1]
MRNRHLVSSRRPSFFLAVARNVFFAMMFAGFVGACNHEQLGAPQRATAQRVPRDVVLIVIDTLRADHLSIYGYPRRTSPGIDRFAHDSILYQSAISPGTWTVAAHGSLFTGLWPSFHGAERMAGDRILAQPLNPDAPMLAELLHRSGFHTAAFVGNYVFLSPSFGFNRGFDEYFNHELYYPPTLSKAVSAWLGTQSDRFFLFVNILDPHEPYEPPAPLDTMFPTKYPEFGSMMTTLVQGGAKVTPKMQTHFISQYDGEIVLADQAVTAILEALKQAGRYDDALIVVTSDHGEFLGEFGMAGHGQLPFEPEVHVPLLVKYPGSYRGGEIVKRRVSTLGVFATIHQALGLPLPARVASRPLDEPQAVWIEDVDSNGNRIRAGYNGTNKIVSTTTAQTTFTWLYDLDLDPGEANPIRNGTGAEALRLALQAFAEASRPVNSSPPPAIDAEREAQLRSLGYIQ